MSFQINDYIRITKLGSVGEPCHTTPTWEEYKKDKASCYSIPTNYTCEGYLLSDIEEGWRISMKRMIRNGVERLGIFTSSAIQKITEQDDFRMVFETHNSRYLVEKVLPPLKSQAGESNWQPN